MLSSLEKRSECRNTEREWECGMARVFSGAGRRSEGDSPTAPGKNSHRTDGSDSKVPGFRHRRGVAYELPYAPDAVHVLCASPFGLRSRPPRADHDARDVGRGHGHGRGGAGSLADRRAGRCARDDHRRGAGLRPRAPARHPRSAVAGLRADGGGDGVSRAVSVGRRSGGELARHARPRHQHDGGCADRCATDY